MADPNIIEKLLQTASEKLIPLQVSIELVSKCNHACLHCYVDKTNHTMLGFHDWKMILDKLRAAKTLYVIFMGGEALLHPEFFKILAYASSLNFHTSLITNGLLIESQEYANQLERCGLNNITISLYSVNDDIHDELTQVKGSCKKAKAALVYSKNTKMHVGINTLLTKINIQDYFLVQEFATKHQVELNSDPVVTCDLLGKKCNLSLRPSQDQLREHFSKKLQKWPESLPAPSKMNDGPICNMARSKCAISCTGDLLPCIEMREPLGNLLVDDFQRIWLSEKADQYRKYQVSDIKNFFQSEVDHYLDACPGMGLNELNDPLIIPDYMKELASIIFTTNQEQTKIFKLPFSGESMWPLLHDGDEVVIDFKNKDCLVGDIVLTRVDGELVVHRVVCKQDQLIIKGDYSINHDIIPKEMVLGTCTGFVRKQKGFGFSKKGQLFKTIIAKSSRLTMSIYPSFLRRFFFIIVFCLNQLSKFSFSYTDEAKTGHTPKR